MVAGLSPRLRRVSRPSDGPKPKVLLVDDHRAILDRVSSLLSDDFDVVGLFTDGRQAIDAAPTVAPDVIVLDINMPGLDGFQTMQALEQAGSRAPVVFLSLVDAEEYVAEAFRRGGRGYVVKRKLVHDLGSALDQVLHGRLFAPSLTSLYRLANGHGSSHAMQVYGDVRSFLDGLATFFDMALRRGDATFIAAREDIREALRARLRAHGWDVAESSGHSRCLVLDIDEVLNRFMRNGSPDPELLAEIGAELEQFRRAVTEHDTSRLTMFADTAAPLITSGNIKGALALEQQWNALTQNRSFFTLCGYATSCFHDGPADLWSNACAEHWAVSQASDL
jgi:DNA-binding NarL/FixJ family response regulator